MKEAASLGLDETKIGLMGESAGACICLGVAQELIKRKEAKLVSMIFTCWPMLGDRLCGGNKSDWTSYEFAFRD